MICGWRFEVDRNGKLKKILSSLQIDNHDFMATCFYMCGRKIKYFFCVTQNQIHGSNYCELFFSEPTGDLRVIALSLREKNGQRCPSPPKYKWGAKCHSGAGKKGEKPLTLPAAYRYAWP
jgi:hypothetical protein